MRRVSRQDPLAGLILAGFYGQTAYDPSPRGLLDLGVGGLIVFARNVVDPDQVATLCTGLHRAGARIVAVDQEGGRVARVRAPLTVWPPMGSVGATGDAELARKVGRGIGEEIGALGMNLDFAPCLDVNSDPRNPVIGDRAFGTTGAAVLATGIPVLEGIQDAGVAACAKHFPGHGHVQVDSHYGLPVCPLSREELEQHLEPFRAAVAAGVAAVMTAHVVYPAVDPDHPATLSPAWIDGVLRGELGWDGAVLTDDLEMGAIVGQGGVGAAAVQAIRAGCDGLLVCHRRDRIEATVRALRSEADRDPAFLARCERSLERLDALAERFPGPPIDPSRVGAWSALASTLAPAVAAADPTEYRERA